MSIMHVSQPRSKQKRNTQVREDAKELTSPPAAVAFVIEELGPLQSETC